MSFLRDLLVPGFLAHMLGGLDANTYVFSRESMLQTPYVGGQMAPLPDCYPGQDT